jgi:hypothetical protein
LFRLLLAASIEDKDGNDEQCEYRRVLHDGHFLSGGDGRSKEDRKLYAAAVNRNGRSDADCQSPVF